MGTEMHVIIQKHRIYRRTIVEVWTGDSRRGSNWTPAFRVSTKSSRPHDCQDYLHQIGSDQITPANAVPATQTVSPSWASAYFSSLILGNDLKLQLHWNTHCSLKKL